MKLPWAKKAGPEYVEQVKHLCERLEWDSSHGAWLMACTAFESAYTFKVKVKNPHSGAVGPLQITGSTASAMGTSLSELYSMSLAEYFVYIEKYFRPYRRDIHSLSDMYIAIFSPKYIGRPDNTVMWQSGTRAYLQNKGLDIDSDGGIEKGEAARFAKAAYELGMAPGNVGEVDWDDSTDSRALEIIERMKAATAELNALYHELEVLYQ